MLSSSFFFNYRGIWWFEWDDERVDWQSRFNCGRT
jgi:hypothetical protein